MWWNSSSQGRQRSSASVSPIPFSSNQEPFYDPADPDWIGDQLEQARLQRSGFYRRLHSFSQRGEDDKLALQKSRRLSPDGVDDTSSSTPVEPPHSSWRFYTSFDNGEWRRHAVPVLKTEEPTKSYTSKPRESDVKRSACQAAESSLRRTRHPRTTAADRQQARLRMRSGDSVENSAYGRWKVQSNSVENFRNTAIGGSLTDLRGTSPPEAYNQSCNSLDVPQILSPSSERFNNWRDSTSPVGLLSRPRLDSFSSPKEEALLSVGSCVVDGIDVTFQEKFIIPTKYKNRENNTATGTPETSKTEVSRSTSAELQSGNSEDVQKKCVQIASVSCMTGQGEVHAVKSSEQRDLVLLGRVNSTFVETEVKRAEMKPAGVTTVRGTGDLDSSCDLKHDQFVIVSRYIEKNTFDEFSESCRIITDEKEVSKQQTTLLIQNGNIEDNTLNPESTATKMEIILKDNIKPPAVHTLSSKTNSYDAKNNLVTSRGRSLDDDVKGKQKPELTADMAASSVTDNQTISNSGAKIVKFVSTFYANVNENLSKEPNDTKSKLSNSFVVSDEPAMQKSSGPVDTKVDPVCSEEDDNWVIEVAVKN